MTLSESIDPRVLELLEEATQAEEGSLDNGHVLREMEGWDSMGMVMFIGLVQRQLDIELSVHDLRESETVADLVSRVRSNGGLT